MSPFLARGYFFVTKENLNITGEDMGARSAKGHFTPVDFADDINEIISVVKNFNGDNLRFVVDNVETLVPKLLDLNDMFVASGITVESNLHDIKPFYKGLKERKADMMIHLKETSDFAKLSKYEVVCFVNCLNFVIQVSQVMHCALVCDIEFNSPRKVNGH